MIVKSKQNQTTSETELPKDWRRVSLRSVAEVRFSNVDKKTSPGELPVRLCNYMDVYANDYIVSGMPFMHASATKAEIARFRLQQGDVIITKDSETPDDIGIPAVVDDAAGNVVCGYHLALIRPQLDQVDPTFLAKQLGHHTTARFFGQRATGSTRYGLANSTVENTLVLLASLKVQKAVASVVRQVDEAIEQTEALIAKHRRINAGLIQDLLTRGIDEHGRLRDPATHKFKPSPLGSIPDEWSVSSVSHEFEITAGFTLGPHRRPRHNRRPYMRVANVQRGFISMDEVAELEASDEEMAARRLKEDDLLVVEGHADIRQIGRCARVPRGAAGFTFQNHLFRLRSITVSSCFAEIWLNSPRVQTYWRVHCGTSSGLNTINRSMLGRVPVALPEQSEQERIVAAIGVLSARLVNERDQLRNQQRVKTGLMQDLLTGKVSIEPLLELQTAN